VKSIFALLFGSFLSQWSLAVIHNEHLKKLDGTLGLGNLELMKLFELFQTMNEIPVIRISPVLCETHKTLGWLASVTWEACQMAKLSRNTLQVREQVA